MKIFTVAEAMACSFSFTIKDEEACKQIDSFLGGYSPVDDPDAIAEKLRRSASALAAGDEAEG